MKGQTGAETQKVHLLTFWFELRNNLNSVPCSFECCSGLLMGRIPQINAIHLMVSKTKYICYSTPSNQGNIHLYTETGVAALSFPHCEE